MTFRWLRFAVVGCLGVIVQLVVVAGLALTGHVDYRVATGLGVAAAVVHNFAWHRSWTWRDRSRQGILASFLLFAGGNGLVSMAGNLAAMQVLVGAFRMPVVAANAIAIAICALVNFTIADRAVFGRGRADLAPGPEGCATSASARF